MIRVGSKEFERLPIERKIKLLVKRGWKQAAFRTQSNAEQFAKEWTKKGYKVEGMRSSGPVIEGGFQSKSYYVIASKR